MTMGYSKLEHLEIAKGIAIVMIMSFHICGRVFHSQPEWFRIASFQGVNVFFVISGFGLAYAALGSETDTWTWGYWLGWLRRRLLRILPLYWAILAISFVVYGFRLSFVNVAPIPERVLQDFISHALLLHVYVKDLYYSINPAWWYLGVLFQLYLAFPLLFYLFTIFRRAFWVPLLFLCAVIVLTDYFFVGPLHLIELRRSLGSSIFFAFGIALAFSVIQERKSLSDASRLISLITGILIAALLLYLLASKLFFPKYLYDVWIVFSLMTFACVYHVSIFLAADHPAVVLRSLSTLLRFFGNNAYAVYLLHWGLILPIVSIFGRPALGIVVYYLATFLIGYAFTRMESYARGVAGRCTTQPWVQGT
jgi:peptidoglycan/LPS O-acetylase OafA/YrhL